MITGLSMHVVPARVPQPALMGRPTALSPQTVTGGLRRSPTPCCATTDTSESVPAAPRPPLRQPLLAKRTGVPPRRWAAEWAGAAPGRQLAVRARLSRWPRRSCSAISAASSSHAHCHSITAHFLRPIYPAVQPLIPCPMQSVPPVYRSRPTAPTPAPPPPPQHHHPRRRQLRGPQCSRSPAFGHGGILIPGPCHNHQHGRCAPAHSPSRVCRRTQPLAPLPQAPRLPPFAVLARALRVRTP
jgi:hypothetical protein